jgi:hypothetical protein
MHRKVHSLGLGVLLAVAVASTISAQIPTGTLNGKVIQEGATGLPGVNVTVTSDALQGSRSAVSNENGDYFLPYLPPGNYTVTFDLEGFVSVNQVVKISAGQTTRIEAALAAATVSEEIVVTGSYETLSTSTQAAVTYEKEFIEELPVNRTIIGATTLSPGVSETGPNKNITIAGSMSFENLFLVNGVVVNENLRAQPFNLFIEDAIEETTVSTSGISAEYGRFAGGVINTITKSGGNDFSASVRTSFTNDSWVAETPLTTTRTNKENKVYEATLGGFLLRDKAWFFAAGRDFDTTLTDQTAAPYRIAFDNADSQTRLEGKLTLSPFDGHRLTGSYIDVDETDGGNYFTGAPILDLDSVTTRSLPQELKAAHYSGVLTENLFVEGQWSDRIFQFIGSGARFTDRLRGTLLINSAGQRWHAATFCGVCLPEERSNENLLGKVNYFLATDSLGSHQLTLGYDTFDDIRAADNHQSGSDYRILNVNEVLVNGDLYPRIIGAPTGTAVSIIQYNPILQSTRGNAFTTNSAYLNDSWQLNDRWSFNVGVRWDENDGTNQAGVTVIKDSKISPRLGLTWDVTGDAEWIVNASFGTYVAAIANNQADSSSSAGNPATFQWLYRGPSVNATGTPTVPTEQALQILFDWFDSVGGPANTLFLRQAPTIPGGTSGISGDLGSPSTDEYVLGVTRRLGSRGLVRADLVHREATDFYMSRSAGRNTLASGRVVDFFLLGNDSEILEREYNGLHLDFRYRLSDRIDIGGNYTLSKTEGNVDGETQANGPVASTQLQFPEYKAFARNTSTGDLATDQRHRARLFARWKVFAGEHHSLSVSGLQTYFSGVPYGALGTINSSPFVAGNPGNYVSIPTAVNYWFTERDAFRADDVLATDISINYSFRFDAWNQGFEVFLQPEVLNLFEGEGVLASNVTAFDTTVHTASTAGSGLQTFNPFTQTPVEGVHWRKGPQFGRPLTPLAYQTPRTFRFSVGLRF